MSHHGGGDARAVLLYVDDTNGIVSREDLQDWLSIVDEVEELKLQYDATRCRACYLVRFRSVAASQLAVQHLSGVLLKGCPVTLLPSTGASSNDAKTATSAAAVNSTLGQVETVPVSDSLPHNHEMPEDLRVDSALLQYIALLDDDARYPGCGALLATLRDLQAQMVDVQHQVAQVDEHALRSDEKLAHAVNAAQASNTGSAAETLAGNAHACFGNAVGIPRQQYTAAALLSRIVTAFGPVAHAGYMIDDFAQTFYIRLSFVMHEDAEAFAVQLCAPGAVAPTGDTICATNNDEAGDARLVSLVKQLRQFDWSVRARPEWQWPRPALLSDSDMKKVKCLV